MLNNNASIYNSRTIVETSARRLGDPNTLYASTAITWRKNRAMAAGHEAVKQYDEWLDYTFKDNILIPVSTSMTQQQYDWLKLEGEFPGLTALYKDTLIAAMLKKDPEIEFPEDMPEERQQEIWEWFRNNFAEDGGPFVSEMFETLNEEMTTGRAWWYLNYPENTELKPYPVLIRAEHIINWETGRHPITGEQCLMTLVVRYYKPESRFKPTDENPQPNIVDYVDVHRITDRGDYELIRYEGQQWIEGSRIVNGQVFANYDINGRQNVLRTNVWKEYARTRPLKKGEVQTKLPFQPINGEVKPKGTVLQSMFDQEASLYNKLTRRNHLLYGTTTYTPVIKSDMTDEDVEKLTQSGLGSWLRVRADEDIDILAAPYEALESQDRAIDQTISTMTKLGLTLLDPNINSEVSGTALAIRNAPQHFRIGMLNEIVSSVVKIVLVDFINYMYDTNYEVTDFSFTMSPDFDPTPQGEKFLRLIGEYYQSGLIDRETFVHQLRVNNIVTNDYNDEEALKRISEDELTISDAEQEAHNMEMVERGVSEGQSSTRNRPENQGSRGGEGQER